MENARTPGREFPGRNGFDIVNAVMA